MGLKIGLALYLLHRLGLWMEQRGWIYYKHKSPGSGAGNALQELNAFMRPSVRHAQEITQKKQDRDLKKEDED